jgi:hypothetical protein
MNIIDAIWSYFFLMLKVTGAIVAGILVLIGLVNPKSLSVSTVRMCVGVWASLAIGTTVVGILIAGVFLSLGWFSRG